MEIQLKDFVARPDQLDAFLAAWSAEIVPLRREVGFQILGAWVDREHDRFVWVTAYDGPDGFAAADDRYHALEARRALAPEPSSLLAEATVVMVADVLPPG